MARIEFKNLDQIINMGGPWVGDLYIDGIKIETNIIECNYIDKIDFFYFVKFFETSRKQNDNFFLVLKIDKNNLKIEMSKEKFDKIYIVDVKDNNMYYTMGFHKNLKVVSKILTWEDYGKV
ncbi:hypothetical protein [Riemerella anatipestifer]|uniref:hypothetical protein n=1 Tax=Riemerella anatipestifer TaxID=34085 RepID=UPI003DA8CE26